MVLQLYVPSCGSITFQTSLSRMPSQLGFVHPAICDKSPIGSSMVSAGQRPMMPAGHGFVCTGVGAGVGVGVGGGVVCVIEWCAWLIAVGRLFKSVWEISIYF